MNRVVDNVGESKSTRRYVHERVGDRSLRCYQNVFFQSPNCSKSRRLGCPCAGEMRKCHGCVESTEYSRRGYIYFTIGDRLALCMEA